MSKVKPNTKIIIKIDKKSCTFQKFNNYKKLFDKAKYLHKLNMI